MQKKIILKHVLFTCISISPVCYVWAVWHSIPEMIPVRLQYGFHDHGVPLQPRNRLWENAGVLSGGCLLVYFLIEYIDKIDPKRAKKPKAAVFGKLAAGTVLLLTLMNFISVFDSMGKLHRAEQYIMTVAGFLLAFIGNIMHNIKPNYFIGIRLPWTLSSDQNWKKTHQLAGKLWFAGGLLFALASLLFPHSIGEAAFILFIAVLVLVPAAYSFIQYRKGLSEIS